MAAKSTGPSGSALRWLGVAAAPAALALGFLWAGGWLSPPPRDPEPPDGELHDAGSYGHGFRRAHSKGVCVTGRFDASGAAASVSKAAIFHEQSVPVVGRFALGAGQPYVTDNPATVRSMALRFMPADAPEWRAAMNDPPVLPLRDAQDASDFFSSQRIDPATGKPDPARAKAFGAAHPWLQAAAEKNAHRVITSGFADDTYHSLDSFLLVGETGTKTAVRWAMVPVQPVAPADAAAGGQDYLFQRLIADIHDHPLQWHMVLTVADPQDAINDPSQIWADGDQTIDAGTLTLNAVESEDGGPCTGLTFDPLILPPGIVASDDPILQLRSGAYMRSFSLRSGEKRGPSAITPAMTQAPAAESEKKS